ncbi:hypothetical protein UF75_4212 [Desulfosporosinus sp. I2]|nr:hypothetical protein UF75_4212 [Desulfosporosinus sp. I2]
MTATKGAAPPIPLHHRPIDMSVNIVLKQVMGGFCYQNILV